LISRSAKKISRIHIKKTGSQPDIAYKVNSDFSAFRIQVEPAQIAHTMKLVQEVTERAGGRLFIRNPIEKDGVLQDIVQYAFAYIPEIGYVTEFQVGHPFASYTFTLDSLIRDRKLAKQPFDDVVDLWFHPEGTNWTDCFYIKMRTKILNPQFEFNVKEGLKEASKGRAVDPVLEKILEAYL
jgi:hypothetical protein